MDAEGVGGGGLLALKAQGNVSNMEINLPYRLRCYCKKYEIAYDFLFINRGGY